MSVFAVRPGLIFVGQAHGKDAPIPPQVKAAINQYGAWYEGDGGDKMKGVSYTGSWDDALAKDVKGYPKEFLFVIFTNTEVNEQKKILVGAGTIFDRLLKTQGEYGYFKGRKFSAETLTDFLKTMGAEYLKRSKAEATKQNVNAFISMGEKDMWESGTTSARKMADKANKYRDMWLLSQPEGVYFVGSDHLKDLRLLQAGKSSGVDKADAGRKNSKLI
jgi:hypothetical protein